MIVPRETAEQWIRDAVDQIPESIRNRLENIAFILEDRPRSAHQGEYPIIRNGELLGLYRGVALPRRGGHYSMVPPDTITIFQDAIERVAGPDIEAIASQIRRTVWHEIAHFLGMDEREVRAWERRQDH